MLGTPATPTTATRIKPFSDRTTTATTTVVTTSASSSYTTSDSYNSEAPKTTSEPPKTTSKSLKTTTEPHKRTKEPQQSLPPKRFPQIGFNNVIQKNPKNFAKDSQSGEGYVN